MWQRLLAFSVHNAGLVLLLAGLTLAFTVFRLGRMPVDVFPELNAPTVTIISECGGYAADEVENYVTRPIENTVGGLPGLRRVRSSSILGLSIVWVEFAWGADVYRARQLVGERLDLAASELPEGVEAAMTPISSITGEIMLISLTRGNEGADPLEMRAFAEYDLRRELLAVPGIAQVVAIGGALPEYQVLLRQDALLLHDIDAGEVAEALAAAHNTATAGFLYDADGLELPIRLDGRVKNIDDIGRCVVAVLEGVPITVADVAEIRWGAAPRRGSAAQAVHNGDQWQAQEAVVLSIQKAPGTNTLALTKAIDAVLDQVKPPEGVTIHKEVMRQSHFIERGISNVLAVLRDAAIIVAAIIVLFLMNLRTTIITLTALPLSLALALLVLWAWGASINVMTLGGLAVAIGELVDDAIIYAENVFRRLRANALLPASERRGFLRVILDACNEIRSSVIFATAIICLVFIPLFFLEGLEGRFFRPLGLAYIAAIGASLLVAMSVTPALCRYLLKGRLGEEKGDGFLLRGLKRVYRPVLIWCVGHAKTVLALSATCTVGALLLASTFGSSFLPRFNEGTFTVFLMTPPGTSLIESERVADGVLARIGSLPGVEHAVRRTGRAERDEHAAPPSNTEIEVAISPGQDQAAVLADIDGILADIPGLSTTIGQPIEHRMSLMMSGTKAALAVNIHGENLAVLRELAKQVESAMKTIPGTRDVAANREVLVTTVPIHFRQQDLMLHGLSAADAGEQVSRLVHGEVVATINDGLRRYDLVTRLLDDERDERSDLGELILLGAEGARLRLRDVASIGLETASNLISHENGRRKTVVSCNVAEGANLGDLVAAVRTKIGGIIKKSGCSVAFGGQFEAQQSASRTLLLGGGAVVILVLLLLQAAFGSLRAAALVLINLPLALIGGILAIYISDSPNIFSNTLALLGLGGSYVAPVISIASMVGFITLFGIAVRNGILLVNHYRHLLDEEGADIAEAVQRGSEERLAPILMTALSAVLGMIPLALAAGRPGSELLAPLAIVVLGGLLFSTILNLLVVPAAYRLFCAPRPTKRS